MERLTERKCDYMEGGFLISDVVVYKGHDLWRHGVAGMTSMEIRKCLNRLADYEDLDERGMVIRDGEPQKCFVNITFDKDDIRELIEEKLEEIELNIDAIREQTIDEFVEMLRKYTFSNNIYKTFIVLTPEQLGNMIKRLKAGEK